MKDNGDEEMIRASVLLTISAIKSITFTNKIISDIAIKSASCSLIFARQQILHWGYYPEILTELERLLDPCTFGGEEVRKKAISLANNILNSLDES